MADTVVIIIDMELSEIKRQELKNSFLQLFVRKDNLYYYDIWDCFEPHEKQYYECNPSYFRNGIVYHLDTLEKRLDSVSAILDWIINQLGNPRILVGFTSGDIFTEYSYQKSK